MICIIYGTWNLIRDLDTAPIFDLVKVLKFLRQRYDEDVVFNYPLIST